MHQGLWDMYTLAQVDTKENLAGLSTPPCDTGKPTLVGKNLVKNQGLEDLGNNQGFYWAQ